MDQGISEWWVPCQAESGFLPDATKYDTSWPKNATYPQPASWRDLTAIDSLSIYLELALGA